MTVRTAIRVISLENAQQRRADFQRDAADAGIAWEFFQACSHIVPPLGYDATVAARQFGRPLNRGEIGCYASHYKVWEWLAASDYDQAFVFEDDVTVNWGAIRELARYNFSKIGIDLMRLYATHGIRGKTAIHRFLSPHYHLLRPEGLVCGTQGYMVTRAGVQRLLAYNKIVLPIDWVIARYWRHRLSTYMLFPFPLFEKYVPSTIGGNQMENTVGLAAYHRLTSFCYRVADAARRRWFDGFVVDKYKFGKTYNSGKPYLRKLDDDYR